MQVSLFMLIISSPIELNITIHMHSVKHMHNYFKTKVIISTIYLPTYIYLPEIYLSTYIFTLSTMLISKHGYFFHKYLLYYRSLIEFN